jgi:hypothetical protein
METRRRRSTDAFLLGLAVVLVGGAAAEAAFGGHGTAGYETRVDTADLARLATIEFVPPRELTPAQGGVLLPRRSTRSTRWPG